MTRLTPILMGLILGDVWRWAGSFRRRDTNIGLPWGQVQTAVEALTLDLAAQVQGGVWSPDEIAVRFHHQLAWIHPFRNGNGRHARLAADVVVTILGRRPFEWGASGDLTDEGPARHDYLAALKSADGLDYSALLSFARTPPSAEPPG